MSQVLSVACSACSPVLTIPLVRRWTGLLAVLIVAAMASPTSAQTPAAEAPLRVAIAGVVHGHVHGIMRAALKRTDVAVVGVWERDEALRTRFGAQYGVPATNLFADLEALIATAKPEALLVNTNTRLWLRFPLLIPPQLRIDGQLHEPEHEHAQTDEGACVLMTEDLRAQLLADWLLYEPYF